MHLIYIEQNGEILINVSYLAISNSAENHTGPFEPIIEIQLNIQQVPIILNILLKG